MSDHHHALQLDDSVRVIDEMKLMTPEVFDSFIMALLRWYEEESAGRSINIPNLYTIFYYDLKFTEVFYGLFLDSYLWRKHHNGEFPALSSYIMSDEERDFFRHEFLNQLEQYYKEMIHDCMKALDNMKLFYVWDESEYGMNHVSVYNNPIIGVW